MPFDCDQLIGYNVGMRIVARWFALLPLLWAAGAWAVDCSHYLCDELFVVPANIDISSLS